MYEDYLFQDKDREDGMADSSLINFLFWYNF